MRCEKFEMMWNDCLDQRMSPQSNEQLFAHAAICPKCAELMAGGELLNFAFPGLPQPALSAGFADRVVASLRTQATDTHSIENASIPVAHEVFSQPVAGSFAIPSGSNSRKRLRSRMIFWASSVAVVIAVVATLMAPKDDNGQKITVTPNAANVVNDTQPVAIPTPEIVKVDPVVAITPASDYFPESSTVAVGSVFRRDHMSQVGFAVADGITPVTKSVSYALQSLKKSAAK